MTLIFFTRKALVDPKGLLFHAAFPGGMTTQHETTRSMVYVSGAYTAMITQRGPRRLSGTGGGVPHGRLPPPGGPSPRAPGGRRAGGAQAPRQNG